MRLKSLLEVIRNQFLRYFLVPFLLLISMFFATSIFYNLNKKKSEDLSYIETVRIPIINSISTFQTQGTQLLLNSISEHRKWSRAFLVSDDNVVLSVFPSNEERHLGAKYAGTCHNHISLESAGVFVAKICYERNILDMIDSFVISSLIGLFLFLFFILFFYSKLLGKLDFFFKKLTFVVNGLDNTSKLQVQPDFLEEEIIIEAIHRLLKLSEEVKTKEIENIKSNAISQVATQMSHDIRSPIATLHHLSEKFKDLAGEDFKLLKSSLERIDEIANGHLNDSRGTFLQVLKENNLSDLITELSNEKKIEFPSLSIELALSEITIRCVAGDFKRILSNLINNSYESVKSPFPKISITSFKKGQVAVIRIQDNGAGIPKYILNNLGKSQVTTKKHGNGLGLKHAMETLSEWSAKLEIISTSEEGTIIEINFPLNENFYVLIDDDELTRLTWEMKAKQNKKELKTFKSFSDFNLGKAHVGKESLIYIDSDLGSEIKGEEIASLLHSEGYTNISMATGYSSESFSKLTFLKSVISKTPPF